ncbi:MAG: hypothetical protein D6698_11355 [Gammaproteobacteria bacterium]|nr:MAG: hypothetical protein D6698_11355 [Gammaproteobacteria bacterium]
MASIDRKLGESVIALDNFLSGSGGFISMDPDSPEAKAGEAFKKVSPALRENIISAMERAMVETTPEEIGAVIRKIGGAVLKFFKSIAGYTHRMSQISDYHAKLMAYAATIAMAYELLPRTDLSIMDTLMADPTNASKVTSFVKRINEKSKNFDTTLRLFWQMAPAIPDNIKPLVFTETVGKQAYSVFKTPAPEKIVFFDDVSFNEPYKFTDPTLERMFKGFLKEFKDKHAIDFYLDDEPITVTPNSKYWSKLTSLKGMKK